MKDHRRLGLGTVQFGQAYGISNRHGRVPQDEVRAILARAARAGLGTLDTAAGYGEAERTLGALDTNAFRIVTKTIGLKNGLDAVVARARESLEILRRRPVDLLLVHAAGDLAGADGQKLWDALLGLRDEGLYRGIGISAYFADDPVALANRFRPNAMQLPVSILDQRLLPALPVLKDLGVEIHVRSLFLQGLLFLPPERLPEKLKSAAPYLAMMRGQFARAGTTPLAAALGFAFARPEIDVALVGVTSQGELEEILDAPPAPALDWGNFAFDNTVVLTPSLW